MVSSSAAQFLPQPGELVLLLVFGVIEDGIAQLGQ
jgi:hypothetical protein